MMSEYTIVEVIGAVPPLQTETGSFYHVLDPLGNVVYGAQYRYMCEDRAYTLNDGTKALRATIQAQQANLQIAAELLEAEKAKTAQYTKILDVTEVKATGNVERVAYSISVSNLCEWCTNGRIAGHNCDMCNGTGLKDVQS